MDDATMLIRCLTTGAVSLPTCTRPQPLRSCFSRSAQVEANRPADVMPRETGQIKRDSYA
jgi:hypothetical protein